MKFIFNILYYIYFFLSGPVLYLIALLIFIITYPFDKRRWVLHQFSIVWALLYFWVSPGWRIRLYGKENIQKGKTYIIASNHRAMFDIPLIYRIPITFRWVSKREVLKMPFVGWLLALRGDVLVKRGDASSAKAMMKSCKEWMNREVSIAIFPEGTRSKDGKVHDFKEGAFLMAKMNKKAILPVVVNGTFEAMHQKNWMFPLRQNFDIHILPEISEEEVGSTSIKEMMVQVHDLIAEKHQEVAPELYQ